MITPAEELGLSGLALAGRVRRAFHALPDLEVTALIRRIREESIRRNLVYLRDGAVEPIRVLPCPLTVLPNQLSYIQYASLTILNALKRLPEIYLEDAAARDLLRLAPEEEAWFLDCWSASHRENNPVFGRLDAMIDYTDPMWKDSLLFVEPNLGGVGGLQLAPTCDRILTDVVVPALRSVDAQLQLDLAHDIRELLMQEMLDHLEALGRTSRNIVFVEPKYAGSGPDEQEALARYYHDRFGTQVLHADPSELTIKNGEVFYDGVAIDLAYRDYEVRDLISLGKEGVDIEPMRLLLRQNRVVSPITAEFDQKSSFELFTDPQFAHRHFSAEERQIFRRHILWTRLVSARQTSLPDGRVGDLMEYAQREHESLVLKPNRDYGGTGVLIGPSMTRAEWEAALDTALADERRWVIQRVARIPVNEFPLIAADGRVHSEPFYTVMGFAPSKYGLAILGRASQKQVVNVSQRGGLCSILVGHPPAPLVGPGAHESERL